MNYFFARLQGLKRPTIYKLSTKASYLGTEDGSVKQVVHSEWTDLYSTDADEINLFLDDKLGVNPRTLIIPKRRKKLKGKREAIIKLARGRK